MFYLSFGRPGHVRGLTPTIITTRKHEIVVSRRLGPTSFYQIAVSCPRVSSADRVIFHFVYHVKVFSLVGGSYTTYVCANVVASANSFACGSGGPRVCAVVDRLVGGNVSGSLVCQGIGRMCSRDHLQVVKCILCRGVGICPRRRTTLVALSLRRVGHFRCIANSARKFIGLPLDVRGITFDIFVHRSGSCIGVSLQSINSFPYGRFTDHCFGNNKRGGTSNKRFCNSLTSTITMFRGNLRRFGPGGARSLSGRS